MNLLSPILKGDRRKSQTSWPGSLPALLHWYQFKQRKENADLELMCIAAFPSHDGILFCFKNRACKVPRCQSPQLPSLQRKHRSRLTRNPQWIPKHEETMQPFATKKQRHVFVGQLSKRGRPRSSVGKYHTHVFMCTNSSLTVHYKFISIKTDGYSVKGTVKIPVPKSIMGNPPSLHQGQMITILLTSQQLLELRMAGLGVL